MLSKPLITCFDKYIGKWRYHIGADTDRFQSVLEHALSKPECLIGTGIYMRPYNSNFKIGKTVRYNNNILISNADTKLRFTIKKFSRSPEFSRSHGAAYLMKSLDKPIKETDNQKMLAKKHNNEKLSIKVLILWAGLTVYHFWQILTFLS